MNVRILLSLLPVAVFFALTRIAPPWVSISGGFVTSAVVLYSTRENRLIGALTLFGFSLVAVSAVIGIVSSSEKAYLASGPVSDFLFTLLYLGSIAIGQPLLGGIARELAPAIAGRIPPRAPVFVWLSLLWALFNFAQGFVRLSMLSSMSVGEYIVWSRVAVWPFSAILLALSAWLIYREARRIELRDGLATVAAGRETAAYDGAAR